MAVVNVYKLASIITVPNTLQNTDFMSYYTAGAIVAAGQADNLHDQQTQDTFYRQTTGNDYLLPYRAVHYVSLFFGPFSKVNMTAAYSIFFGINLTVFLIALKAVVSQIGLNIKPADWLVGLLSFKPIVVALGQGQTSIVLFAVIVGIYIALKKEYYLLAGLITALLTIKLQFLVLVPFILLLANNRHKYLVGFITGLAVLGLITAQVFGNPAEFIKLLVDTQNETSNTPVSSIYSMQYFLHLYFDLPIKWAIGVTGVVYLVTLLSYYKTMVKRSFDENFALAVLTAPVFALHVLVHDLVIWVLPTAIYLKQKKYVAWLFGLNAALFLLYKTIPGVMGICVFLGILFITYEKDKRNNQQKHQKLSGSIS